MTAESHDNEAVAGQAAPPRAVLVTGAGGYLGRLVTRALAEADPGLESLVALDLTEPAQSQRIPGVDYLALDIRAPDLGEIVRERGIDTVVHLASIVSTAGVSRELQYDVDVNGTRNVLDACRGAGVAQLVVTSSGSAYGFHPDNASRLTEDDPLRADETFAYGHHKRLVEEMLAEHRERHPELEQLVLRPGTILGDAARGPIADFFEKPVIWGLQGVATPFVFIWDGDVVACIVEGVLERKTGIYNLAGDGVMTLREVAKALGKPFVPVPRAWIETALGLLERRGLTQYGPEHVSFLAHRPVLANERLKAEFGYRPKTSRDAFAIYARSRLQRGAGEARSLGGRVQALATGAAAKVVTELLTRVSARRAG